MAEPPGGTDKMVKTYIVDTREQKPLWTCKARTQQQKLDVGDYTTIPLENVAHAERKSGADFYSSITSNHKRFRRMLLRAIKEQITLAIFVECTEEAFYTKSYPGGYGTKVSGSVLKKIVNTISTRYEIDVFWCAGRNDMRKKLRTWLREMERHYLDV